MCPGLHDSLGQGTMQLGNSNPSDQAILCSCMLRSQRLSWNASSLPSLDYDDNNHGLHRKSPGREPTEMLAQNVGIFTENRVPSYLPKCFVVIVLFVCGQRRKFPNKGPPVF